ncbi:MAG: sigma 54-interacting transcriptional regulator [Candidatus Aureabacteria bacterium]|nr:sigma 54-interacting transcriptional regulator [Candidatus Auribacterota bacterium]
MSFLIINYELPTEKILEIKPSPEILIGRGTTNHVNLSDKSVSRKHAKLCYEINRWRIEDVGSSYGLFVNDKRSSEHYLKTGDKITIGNTEIIFTETLAEDRKAGNKTLLDTTGSSTHEVETDIMSILAGGDTSYLEQTIKKDDVTSIKEMKSNLAFLFKLTSRIADILNREELFDELCHNILSHFEADCVAIMLKSEGDEILKIAALLRRENSPESLPSFSATTFDKVLNENVAVLATPKDTSAKTGLSGSIMVTPLRMNKTCIGVIHVESTDREKYDDSTLNLLSAIVHQIDNVLKNIELKEKLKEEKHELETALNITHQIIGKDLAIQELLSKIAVVAPTNSTVLIEGESGTGKELVARAIHFNSKLKDNAFVVVNCATFTKNLAASELFGHVKGAFTGAAYNKKGLFEKANGGTIVLDEIGELDSGVQANLLRVLEHGEFYNVGGNQPIKVEVRLIASTNQDLGEAAKKGTFRQDLYYRLNIINFKIPPLRDRAEDILPLVKHFMKIFMENSPRKIKGISKEALDVLQAYRWPGNVRELKNVIEKTMILGKNDPIMPNDLPYEILRGSATKTIDTSSAMLSLKDIEKKHILRTLELTGWNKKKTSEMLGIDRTTLYKKIQVYRIEEKK